MRRTKMRIIAGKTKGRKLKSVGASGIRPTSDRVREALFSILASRFDLRRTILLDLFAGSGALGIEALSRGAERIVFVEQSRQVIRILDANLELCGLNAQAEVSSLPVVRALRQLERSGRRFDGVLLDPPYGKGLADETLVRLGRCDLLRDAGWVMVEAHVDDPLREDYEQLRLTVTRRYGKTVLALFMVAALTSRGAAT